MEYEVIICETTGKRCYSSRTADIMLKSAKNNTRCRKSKIPRRKYYCEYCHTYHLTGQKVKFNKSSKNRGFLKSLYKK